MWGSRADMYNVKAYKATSMKWHLVNENSLEEREIEVGYKPKRKATRTYGVLMCGGKPYEWMVYNKYSSTWSDIRIPLVLKDTVNLNGSGICTYCKNFRLRELGLNEKVMG